MTPEHFSELVAKEGLLVMPLDHRTVRAVTHYGIDRDDAKRTVAIIQKAMSSVSKATATSGKAVAK